MEELNKIKIGDILFLDIETAPLKESFEECEETYKKEWIKKMSKLSDAPLDPKKKVEENMNYDDAYFQKKYDKYFSDKYNEQASFYPEFSKIICVSLSFFFEGQLRVKSIYNENEKDILIELNKTIEQYKKMSTNTKLCAHYGNGFDFPFIAKRMMANRIKINSILDNYGKKPWERNTLCTWEIWKAGGTGHSASLGAIALTLGIEYPKNNLDGSKIKEYYYSGRLEEIKNYCEEDVKSLAEIIKTIKEI